MADRSPTGDVVSSIVEETRRSRGPTPDAGAEDRENDRLLRRRSGRGREDDAPHEDPPARSRERDMDARERFRDDRARGRERTHERLESIQSIDSAVSGPPPPSYPDEREPSRSRLRPLRTDMPEGRRPTEDAGDDRRRPRDAAPAPSVSPSLPGDGNDRPRERRLSDRRPPLPRDPDAESKAVPRDRERPARLERAGDSGTEGPPGGGRAARISLSQDVTKSVALPLRARDAEVGGAHNGNFFICCMVLFCVPSEPC